MIFKTFFMRTHTMDIMKNRSYDKIYNIKEDMDKCLKIAADALKRDQIIAVPTDTVYGICGNAQNGEVLERIYEIKERVLTKPISLCVPNFEEMARYGKIEQIPIGLLQKLLPGPLTVVVYRTPKLNLEFNFRNTLVGMRMPDNEFLKRLSAMVDFPLALTSANKSNYTSTVAIEEFSELWNRLDAIFDGGRIGESRNGSTIVQLSCPGKFHFVRKGDGVENITNALLEFEYREI